ncbi:hypothetical protein chiPu_0025830, partial [Chiloscyllium punctatum]|nr:hypothetical protein [Chiloscyllium punctatum]
SAAGGASPAAASASSAGVSFAALSLAVFWTAGAICHGELWAPAENVSATLKPAASTGSLAQPNRNVEVIPSPQIPERQCAFAVAQNCGNGTAKANDQRVICLPPGRAPQREDGLRA